jgi:hypothetical protein
MTETVESKPSDEREKLFDEFYDIGKRLGLKKEHLDSALLLGPKSRNLLGARQILFHDADFIRAFQFMSSYQYGRGNIDAAFDAELGLINLIASVSAYNSAFRLDPKAVLDVNEVRDDVAFLEDLVRRFRGRVLLPPDVHSLEQFYRKRGLDEELDPVVLLDSLRRSYKRQVDSLMVKVKVALYPLASSRRNQQSGEPGKDSEQSQSEPSVDVGSLALGAVAGTRPPKEDKSEE